MAAIVPHAKSVLYGWNQTALGPLRQNVPSLSLSGIQ